MKPWLAPNDPRHGSTNGYTNLGCRCPSCRAANSAAVKVWRSRQDAADATHGTVGGYQNYGCRCGPCSVAQANATRAHSKASA